MTGSTQIFMGADSPVQSPTVVLSDTKTGATATCSITLNTDGTITVAGSGSSSVPPAWYSPTTAGIGSSYWCKCTVNSGSAPGNPNTVLALSSAQSFGLTRAALGSVTGNWTISIYRDAGGTQLAGVPFTFNATATWQ